MTEVLLLILIVMVFFILRSLRTKPETASDLRTMAIAGKKVLSILTLMLIAAMATVLIWLLAVTTGIWLG